MEPEHIIDEEKRTLLRVIIFFLIVVLSAVTYSQIRFSPMLRPLRVGYYFEYPKGMNVTEHRIIKGASLKRAGYIYGESENETVAILWMQTFDDEVSRSQKDIVMIGDYETFKVVKRGQLRKSSTSGHELFFRTFTARGMNETVNGIGSVWICNNSGREFNFHLLSHSNDVHRSFEEYVDDFKCHGEGFLSLID
jgi:hypothetical protein